MTKTATLWYEHKASEHMLIVSEERVAGSSDTGIPLSKMALWALKGSNLLSLTQTRYILRHNSVHLFFHEPSRENDLLPL